jgi:hypothetical protein
VQLRRLRCCPSLVQRNGSSTEDSKKGKEEGLPSGSVIKSIPLFDPRGHMMMCQVGFPAQEGMSRTVNLTPLLRRRPFLFSVCCMFSRGMLIIRELSVWEQETTSNERHDVFFFSPNPPPPPPPPPAQEYPATLFRQSCEKIEEVQAKRREEGGFANRKRKTRIIVIVMKSVQTRRMCRKPLWKEGILYVPCKNEKPHAHVSGKFMSDSSPGKPSK